MRHTGTTFILSHESKLRNEEISGRLHITRAKGDSQLETLDQLEMKEAVIQKNKWVCGEERCVLSHARRVQPLSPKGL